MAAQKKQKEGLRLNLLHPQGIPEKLPLRFLKWMLAYGRYIVVVVEIIVLASFAARFKLDADLADIKQKIDREVPFIENKAQDEALINQTQLKLTTVKQTYAKNPDWKGILTKISNQVPSSVHLTGINFSNADKVEFKIAAQSNSNADLASFLNGLKSDPTFVNITLANISFDQGDIVFSISGGVK